MLFLAMATPFLFLYSAWLNMKINNDKLKITKLENENIRLQNHILEFDNSKLKGE